MKIVILGAGSYVFGPSMLEQALLEHDLQADLCLVDVDEEALELTVGAGGRIAEALERNVRVSGTTDRKDAFVGADFVICSVSVGTLARFRKDVELIRRYAPGHLITDFGGVAGISVSLRQIALIESVVTDMTRLCPDAWLLNVSNPLPRVCQAASELGVKTVGLCSVASVGVGLLAKALLNEDVRYPFEPYTDLWTVKRAGLNHFSWLLSAEDEAGRDLTPSIRQHADALPPLTAHLLRQTGYLPMPGDDHIRDFVKPHPQIASMSAASHGDALAREKRLKLLRRITQENTQENTPWEPLFEVKSWERPVDVITALTGGGSVHVDALNLPNTGQLPDLPPGAFVETACEVDEKGFHPLTSPLPDTVLPLCQRTAHVTQAIVKGALGRDRAGLSLALELDPTVTDKAACERALDACIEAHQDLLPRYS